MFETQRPQLRNGPRWKLIPQQIDVPLGRLLLRLRLRNGTCARAGGSKTNLVFDSSLGNIAAANPTTPVITTATTANETLLTTIPLSTPFASATAWADPALPAAVFPAKATAALSVACANLAGTIARAACSEKTTARLAADSVIPRRTNRPRISSRARSSRLFSVGSGQPNCLAASAALSPSRWQSTSASRFLLGRRCTSQSNMAAEFAQTRLLGRIG